MWVGKEVEGRTDLGEKTLFVRECPDITLLLKALGDYQINRIWFCATFLDYQMIQKLALNKTLKICMEIYWDQVIPYDLTQRCQLYLKLNPARSKTVLKTGDHICYGLPFQDESFQIGTGNKVTKADYGKDIQIL